MTRSMTEALKDRPLFFEPVPPQHRIPPARLRQRIDEVRSLVGSVARVDAIDVPELVDENHDGRPYYRSGDPRHFALQLGDGTGRAIVVNKVVAHMRSAEELAAWTEETVRLGVHHVVLVGGSSRYIPYPGPPVTEANRVCAPILSQSDGSLGNIAIPQRTGEAHRMLQKTRAGARFFTTQILFDSEAVLQLVRSYDGLCRQSGLVPAPVLLSVAPLADEADAEFVRWLGADLPESAENGILNGDESRAVDRSIDNALSVWGRVVDAVGRFSLEVPVGVNVEQLSPRHLESAGAMLRAFAKALERKENPPPAT
ncbi:MAG: hypothetical protein WCA77_09150 [Thermoplasmata archaeon]